MKNAELIASFPEINPANYTDDDVNALNAWGIAAHSAIEALEAEVERLTALYENSTAAHEETVGRAMRAEAQLAAAQGQPVQVNAMLVEALEEARNGLAWYQEMYPAATDGSDDEAMERIDAALAAAEHGASNAQATSTI